jgi:hypothetical protein
MRWFPVIALVLGCGGPPASPRPSVPATPPSPPIEAEIVTELTAPAIGRAAMIDYLDEAALTIDEAGIARQTLRVADQRWIPFSEPVDDVVFVKWFSYPHNVPGAQLGKMFCGRTRTARLECVIDFDATPKEPKRVHRFKLPVTGAVQHLGVYTPWLPQGGPDKAICVTATVPACWSFDWVGTRAERYTLEASVAEAATLRIAQDSRLAWQRAAPAVTAANIREVVHTDPQDVARIIGKEANITVHCARLVNGELWCFGPGVYGELGDGTLALTPRASRPLGDTQVVDVAAGRHHVCAVVADGRVACWGALYGSMPLPKRHNPTQLPMCPLDRSASTSKFAADRSAAIQRAADCAKGCDGRGRDGCLGCVVRCIPMPYLFRHDEVCQEPVLESALVQRGETCVPAEQPPRWLTDAELRNYSPEEKLTLSPVFLTGITDAVGVTASGPRLCVIRRSGDIACLDDGGKLSPLR